MELLRDSRKRPLSPEFTRELRQQQIVDGRFARRVAIAHGSQQVQVSRVKSSGCAKARPCGLGAVLRKLPRPLHFVS